MGLNTVIISSLKSDIERVGRDKKKKGYLFIVKISNARPESVIWKIEVILVQIF